MLHKIRYISLWTLENLFYSIQLNIFYMDDLWGLLIYCTHIHECFLWHTFSWRYYNAYTYALPYSTYLHTNKCTNIHNDNTEERMFRSRSTPPCEGIKLQSHGLYFSLLITFLSMITLCLWNVFENIFATYVYKVASWTCVLCVPLLHWL